MFLLVSVRQVWCLSTWAPAWRLHTNLFAPKLGNRCFCWFPSAKFGAHPGGHQHGFSIQISINLGKTFLRISRIQIILLTWILARNLVYLPPFISQIPDFIYWTVLIFILIYFEWRDTENQQLQHSSWKERWGEKWNKSSKKCFRHETSRLSTPIPFLPRQYGCGISKRIKRTTVKSIYWCSKYSFNESVGFLAMAISISSSLRHISSIFAKLLLPVFSKDFP